MGGPGPMLAVFQCHKPGNDVTPGASHQLGGCLCGAGAGLKARTPVRGSVRVGRLVVSNYGICQFCRHL